MAFITLTSVAESGNKRDHTHSLNYSSANIHHHTKLQVLTLNGDSVAPPHKLTKLIY
jgi:hypothetical protein